jgi:hypothetical protein
MKRDGRQLDHKTLEEIRRMSVERVREGEDPSAVIASYGFCRTTIYKWLNTAKGRGRGLAAFTQRDWPPSQADSGTGTAGLSLDQRQGSTSIWF